MFKEREKRFILEDRYGIVHRERNVIEQMVEAINKVHRGSECDSSHDHIESFLGKENDDKLKSSKLNKARTISNVDKNNQHYFKLGVKKNKTLEVKTRGKSTKSKGSKKNEKIKKSVIKIKYSEMFTETSKLHQDEV